MAVSLIAFIVAVTGGKLYSWATRPAAPAQIALMLRVYAPGVMIGEPVADTKKYLADMRYVPHVGFVATNASAGRDPGSSTLFPQVRLLLDRDARSKGAGRAMRADIDAVELVTARAGASAMLQPELLGLFGMPAGRGCLRSGTPGNYRDVTWWSTPARRGGAALVHDHVGNADKRHPGQMVVNLLLFAGEFEGGTTLRGNFEARECRKIAGSA